MIEVTDKAIIVNGVSMTLEEVSQLRKDLEDAIFEFARKSFYVS